MGPEGMNCMVAPQVERRLICPADVGHVGYDRTSLPGVGHILNPGQWVVGALRYY